MTTEDEIRKKFEALSPVMDERLTRLWAAAEADVLGHGGIATVERATGMSRTTIRDGLTELRDGVSPEDVVQVRRAGGGR
ncbi:MAG: ISAzo13 family transposase, partial [Myxococcota bacterium]|nr:ISAzo13 family transposase [Myxococcota bacterium]